MKQKYINNCLIILIFLASIFLIIQMSNSFLAFIYEVYNLLLPFIVGVVGAYLLNPYVQRLRKFGVPKIVSIILCVIILLYALLFIGSNFVPLFITQVNELIDNIPSIIESINNIIDKLRIGNYLDTMINFENISKYVFDGFGKYASVFVLSPIIAIYLVFEYDNIIAFFKRISNERLLFNYLKEINYSLKVFFQGVIWIMGALSLASALLFMWLGLEYSIVLGIIVGLTNVIPFIGPYIGMILVGGYALSVSPIKAILAIIIIQTLQMLESNFFTPYVHGKRIKQSPLLILLSFTVFGKYFGIIGMILSVPLLSIITISIKYLKLKYLQVKGKCI